MSGILKNKSPVRGNPKRGATRLPNTNHQHHGWVWLCGLAIFATTVTIAAIRPAQDLFPAEAPVEKQSAAISSVPAATLPTTEQDDVAQSGMATADTHTWKQVRIQRGDTLSHILNREGIEHQALLTLIKNEPKARLLNQLQPGKYIKLKLDNEQHALHGLSYMPNYREELNIQQTAYADKPAYEVVHKVHELETRLSYKAGVITSSLFEDGQKAGLSDIQILKVVEIFGWDIDFARDVHKYDSFAVIYEEKYWLGQKVGDGPIIAAEFINQNKTFRAIAHHREDISHINYYTPEGLSMRQTFLRTPVRFSRISSGFTTRRYHPILKRWRAHQGVDYAAPRGTPVRATATGRVTHVGRKGGYGNTIIIKHGGKYSTLYAHLNGYKNGVRRGSHVEQGQIIGYVGSTGLASGPHLHYEFRVNDRHHNPLKYRFPRANPIAEKYAEAFASTAKEWAVKLDRISARPVATRIAENKF